ncbi:MAG: hypothetical protein GX025_06775 [Clostridiales bacterium]|nr:hypothetical protein [Clostridiales bacterium]
MSNKPEILELLTKKKDLFFEIEDLTEKMKYAPVEELSDIFEARGKVLSLVGEIDNEIRELSYEDKALKSLLNNSSSPEGLSGMAADIYKASLSVKAVANRVLNSEPELMSRIEDEKQKILSRIEEMNSSSHSVAGSYMKSVQTGITQTPFTTGEKSI